MFLMQTQARHCGSTARPWASQQLCEHMVILVWSLLMLLLLPQRLFQHWPQRMSAESVLVSLASPAVRRSWAVVLLMGRR